MKILAEKNRNFEKIKEKLGVSMDWDKLKERGMGENPEQKTERERERRREVKTPLLKGREVRTKKGKEKKE